MSERNYIYYAPELDELFTLSVKPSVKNSNKVHNVFMRFEGKDHILIRNVFYIGEV